MYKSDITKLEAVQRRFTKRLKNCSCLGYAQRLKYLNAETLEMRRLRHDLIMVFKILHGLIILDHNDFFQLSRNNYTRGHAYKLVKPICVNNARQYSFSCRIIDCWNSLSTATVNVNTVACFEEAIRHTNLNNYLYISQ